MANRLHMKVRHTGLGPGGWHCTCCSPAKRHRTAWCRTAKRSERHAANQEAKRELKE